MALSPSSNPWTVSEAEIVPCINRFIQSGRAEELGIMQGTEWYARRSPMDEERTANPELIMVDTVDGLTMPLPALGTDLPIDPIIWWAIKAGCIENRGPDNVNYRLVP